ncbi:NUDIX domain-containing protein [Runella aurantiaca]|uniref:NUDIX domain-containing protein n=1 Tax=Runella aurantiaca TaxID=2282308 RepID=A0A369I9R8_9BACT|nr:NUDIX domain-containing protein [Runella aurantiaca]RDB03406.1 NUDIX domain-containing protein [Runella aurantiaca]
MNPTVKKNQTLFPAVAAAIFNEQGEILLQRRRDVDQWGVISGHVEFGETVVGAIVREIWEETNTQAHIKRLIGVYSAPASQTYHYPDKSVQYVTTYFEAQLTGMISKDFSKEETLELQFFKTDQLPDNLAMMNPHWLRDALSQTGQVFIR